MALTPIPFAARPYYPPADWMHVTDGPDLSLPRVAWRETSLASRLLLVDRLDVDLEVDFVADQEAARLERGVPVQAELLAVDLAADLEARHLLAPRVLAAPEQGRVEHDGARHAADRQVAVDPGRVGAGRLDPCAGEGDRRILLDVEEVGRSQVAVALLLARVDRRRVHLDLDRGLRRVRLVEHDRAGDAGEAALRRSEHHVLDTEANRRVLGIDLPHR